MQPHNFVLSEEQDMILDTVRKFVQDTVAPAALENDEQRRFVRGSFDGLAELGLLGLPISEANGGAELGLLSLVVALEELASACGSSARLLLCHTGMCGRALDGAGAGQDILGQLAAGEKLAAFVGPEFQVRAEPAGDSFVLTGKAELVITATEADMLVVAATSGDGTPLLFCLDAGTAKIEAVPALGFRAAAPGRVVFDGTTAAGNSLVAQGAGVQADGAQAALDRASLAACIGDGGIAIGMAAASIEAARRHASERVAFGKTLDKHEAVVRKLSESHRATEAARHMVYHAARLADAGEDAREAARMARLTAVEAAVFATDEAVQIHGGYGYVVEYHVERHYRDAQTLVVL